MNYAILETGGKQVRAEVGKVLRIEKCLVETGETFKIDKVLLVQDGDSIDIGKPYVKGCYAEVQVMDHFRAPKVISFKYIRREGSAKTKIGHRQNLMHVKILSIKKD